MAQASEPYNALEDLQARIDADDHATKAYSVMSRLMALACMHEEARTAYLESVERDPTLADLGYYFAVRAGEDQRKEAKAERARSEYGLWDPPVANPDPEGRTLLLRLVDEAPQDAEARLRLVVHLVARGDERGARQALEREPRLDHPLLTVLRQLLAGEADAEDLMQPVKALWEQDPYAPLPHLVEAVLLRRLGQDDEAESAYRAASSTGHRRDLAFETWILGRRVRAARVAGPITRCAGSRAEARRPSSPSGVPLRIVRFLKGLFGAEDKT